MLSSPRRHLICDLLTPPLILATPFVSFVNYNDYSYAAAEIWISLAVLLAVGVLCGLVMAIGGPWLRIIMYAGLVTLFVDLQFDWFDGHGSIRIPALAMGALLLCWLMRDHLSRIAASVFATMFVATLAFPGASGESVLENPSRRANAPATSTSAPPTLVHLIFDGFIGVEGIPSDMPNGPEVKGSLRSFFHANGFYLFGRAYSRVSLTRFAIPSTLNYGSMPANAQFAERSGIGLNDNRYFQEMHEKGYDIHVYQTDYLDFCKDHETQVTSCHTFINTGIKPLEPLQLSPVVKTEIVLRIFFRASLIIRALDNSYGRLRRAARERGSDLPPWELGRYTLAPARALQTLDRIADDVAKATAGEMFFAHIFLPHEPFALDRTCKLRDDPRSWNLRAYATEMKIDSGPARAEQYPHYLEQMLCVRAKLQEMFDTWRRTGVYDRMKIVLHGDHGSRIPLHDPTEANKDRMVLSDYTDSFSTLFATKMPDQEAAYDTRMVAIQDLLMPVAQEGPLSQLPVSEAEPYVWLENGHDWVRQLMPEFGSPH